MAIGSNPYDIIGKRIEEALVFAHRQGVAEGLERAAEIVEQYLYIHSAVAALRRLAAEQKEGKP